MLGDISYISYSNPRVNKDMIYTFIEILQQVT